MLYEIAWRISIASRPLHHLLHSRRDQQRQDGAAEGHGHVLLGVPRIALGAEVVGAQTGEEDVGHAVFDELVHAAEGEGDLGRQHPADPQRPLELVHEVVAHGIGEQKTKTEVDDPVVGVPLQPHNILDPVSKGRFGIRMLRTKDVQTDVDKGQRVGEVAEAEATVRADQDAEEDHRQDVLDDPVRKVRRVDESP